jgi:hypothetical protein
LKKYESESISDFHLKFHKNENASMRKKLWKYFQNFKHFEDAATNILDADKGYEKDKYSRCFTCFGSSLEFPDDDELKKNIIIL